MLASIRRDNESDSEARAAIDRALQIEPDNEDATMLKKHIEEKSGSL